MTVCLRVGRLCVAITIILFVGVCARATVFDFSSAAQLENNFSVHTLGDPDAGRYVWSAQAGAGGQGGRLDVEPVLSWSFSVLFSSFTFDLNQGPAEVSMLFQGGAASGGAVPRIALLLHTEREAVNLGDISLKTLWLQDGQGVEPAQFRAGGEDDPQVLDGLAAFTVGHWYGMKAVWSLGDDGNSVQIVSELWDYGADGAQPVSLIAQITARITDSSLFGNGGVVSPLYLGIIAQYGLGGAAVLDDIRIAGNFSGVFIPEPALAAVCMLGGVLLLCALYRRRD